MFEIGQILELNYPICTRVNCQLEFRPRRLIVRRIRDLVIEPLSPLEYGRRPLLMRGRYLIEAQLPDGTPRRFYPSSSREFYREAPLRIGIYDPVRPGLPFKLFPVQYGPTVKQRIQLMRDLKKMLASDSLLQLGILADDLRRVDPEPEEPQLGSLRRVG